MIQKRVLVSIGDLGAAADLVFVIRALLEAGQMVRILADPLGKGVAVIEEELLLEHGLSADEGLGDFDVLLAATNATAQVMQLGLTALFQELGKPVVWFEDIPGTAHQKLQRVLEPDLLLVTMPAAEMLARSVRSSGLAVRVVGKPSFAARRELLDSFEERRAEERRRFDLADDAYYVAYVSDGDSAARVDAAITALLRASSIPDLVLIPRLHPRLVGQEGVWRAFTSRAGLTLLDLRVEPMDVVLAIADDVVLDWGRTDQYLAALSGLRPVVQMFPDDRERLDDAGFVDGVPPLLAAGCGEAALSEDHLVDLLQEAARQRSLGQQQREVSRRLAHEVFDSLLDPNSTQHIVASVLGVC